MQTAAGEEKKQKKKENIRQKINYKHILKRGKNKAQLK